MPASEPVGNETLMQAGEWLLELQSADVTVERIAQWRQWLGSSEQHARAFDQLQQTWSVADQLSTFDRDALPWPTSSQTETLIGREDARLRCVEHSGVARGPHPTSRTRRTRSSLFAAAAAMVLTIASGFWFAQGRAGLVLETAVGEQRNVRLSDGSVIFVGPASRLRVTLGSDRRRVDLDRGEAYFQVAKDPLRRFTVHAGSASVTAIGTAFNVRRNRERLVIAVSEGTVAISSAQESLLARLGLARSRQGHTDASTRLLLGQQLVIEPDTSAEPEIQHIAPPAVASWRKGRLHYSGEPLGSIIADVNRFVAEPIEIADASIASLRVTGTVTETNIESWLTSLETSLPVEVVTGDDGRLEVRARSR